MTRKVYTIQKLIAMRPQEAAMDRSTWRPLLQAVQKEDLAVILRRSSEDEPLPHRYDGPTATKVQSEPREPRDHPNQGAATIDGRRRYLAKDFALDKDAIRPPEIYNHHSIEGFKRFYKAVVSPTHVRVTAGGRIVPNTRGPPSPTTKATVKEKEIPPSNNPNQNSIPPTFNPGAHMSQFPYGQLPPPFYGYPGMVATPLGFAPMHYGLGFPGGFGFPQFPASNLSATQNATNHGSRGTRPSNGPSLDGSSIPTTVPPIQPPGMEQLDIYRSYLNGQWGLIPYGALPYVMSGMVSHPSLQGGSSQGPNASSGAASGLSTDASALSAQYGRAFAVPHFPPPTGAPPKPPISSIRPSQITKAHLESLRSNLKVVENQLRYNVHQIDVPSMQETARELKTSIAQLEAELPKQLEHEELYYPKENPPKSRNASGFSHSGGDDRKYFSLRAKKDGQRHSHRASYRNGMRQATNSSRSDKSCTLVQSYRASTSDEEPMKLVTTSSLPATAAAAPPFQPRSEKASSTTTSMLDSTTATDGVSVGEVKVVDNAPAKGATSQATVSDKTPDEVSTSSGGYSVRGMMSGLGRSVINIATSLSRSSDAESKTPYLVGRLKPGIEQENATQNDFIYPRPLTEEEIRARHLYWGQAPQSALKGLPKFDGKDFYPASPTKSKRDPAPSVDSTAAVADSASRDKKDGSVGSTKIATYLSSKPSLDKVVQSGSKALSVGASGDTLLPAKNNTIGDGKKTNELWQSIHKKGHPASLALTGEITATSVQGQLPPFISHAAASLAPTIVNVPGSPYKPSGKGDNSVVGTAATMADKCSDENRPPNDHLAEPVCNVHF